MADTDMVRAAVIMAGGSGERFWPLSRRLRPKQLLKLTSEDLTMLEEAINRIEPVIPAENVFVVTGEHLLEPIRSADTGLPDENVVAEPCKRNTTGALIYAAAVLKARYDVPEASISMAILTADHRIGNAVEFQRTVDSVMNAAEAHHTLATIGVVPSRPETGYGYIQAKKEAGPISGARQGYPVYDVTAFHEKPNRDKAQDFVEAGNYYWNSGMFFWRVSVFLGELEQARPEFAKKARDIAEAIKASDYPQARKIFESLEDISVDYALMEHAKRVIVAEATFDWDDVGAWPALDRSLPKDADGNVTAGQPVVIDSEDCIVYNAAGPDAMSVAVVGARDLVVVTTDDAVLVLPKDRAQDVKAAVKELKQRNSPHV